MDEGGGFSLQVLEMGSWPWGRKDWGCGYGHRGCIKDSVNSMRLLAFFFFFLVCENLK